MKIQKILLRREKFPSATEISHGLIAQARSVDGELVER